MKPDVMDASKKFVICLLIPKVVIVESEVSRGVFWDTEVKYYGGRRAPALAGPILISQRARVRCTWRGLYLS